ncbi:hypothetical protein OIU76_009074 [Salix suchowensis]|nr:hypothetical protein OIU76_009074 [Salix suchowensis]KAJ6361739.1 hypothetical protein OIU78_002211 [Salix suchowensis]
MGTSMRSWMAILIMVWLTLVQGVFVAVDATFDYKDALTKSLIFLEAQRSGKLPPNHRPQWRGDSGLDDGKLANVDLAGGYYDAGRQCELPHVRSAIKWGTDYFLKASSRKNRLYVQVGDPVLDHQCWLKLQPQWLLLPLYLDTLIVPIPVDSSTKPSCCLNLLKHTRKPLMENAHFYCSYSGYNDELLWAATWLYKATNKPVYFKYIKEEATSAAVAEFSWDLKYAGAQVLLSKLYFEGVKDLESYKKDADSFICSVLPDSPYHQVYISPGGMINLRDGANTQYVTSTAFLFSVYSDILAKHGQKVQCGNQEFDSTRLMAFAKQQIDYLLGSNPEKRSYMVGFGQNPPVQAHHRGASVPVMSTNTIVNCGTSFANWFNKDAPNPHELTGAFVGGPDRFDNFVDKRWDSSKTEPCTYVNSISVGVLAKLATPGRV